MATDRWGIDEQYEDALGKVRSISAATRAKILAAMQVDSSAPVEAGSPVQVIGLGEPLPDLGAGEIELEDGTCIDATAAPRNALPLGYHSFRSDRGGHLLRLIVSPGRCPLPRQKIWGWASQLYATRSAESWGIGDLGDLRHLARWSAAQGARIVLVNPLGAAPPVLPQTNSPYYSSSRRFRNPLYLRIEEVPGYAALAREVEPVAAAGRALNQERLIQRNEVFRLKIEALEKLWQRFEGHAAFDDYCRGQGASLVEYATYCRLVETFGKNWRGWDRRYRRPDTAAVARFSDEQANRVRFHQWLQWLIDEQLARAAAELPILQDLPIGTDPDGADAWAWQDMLAEGVCVGAPPDLFNTQGQNWGLPPFIPHKLRSAHYEPFIQCIRATLRHAGGMRIDHALGLFRLFWIPDGSDPAEGAYVRYAAEALLAIVALESHRAGAFVVGEDLGTLEAGVHEQLARHQMLSYRLLWFEKARPSRYPKMSLAAVTTHDLPTIAGLWTLRDLEARRSLKLAPNEKAELKMRSSLCKMVKLAGPGTSEEAVEAAYRLLSEAPSLVTAATLEDALAVEERPNMPNTRDDQWPNWCLALPKPLESLEQAPLAGKIAAALNQKRTS